MSGRKKYVGERYSFVRKDKEIDHGGNGAIYDVQIEEIDYPVVAKFFEYDGIYKQMRYKRFKKEIEFAYKMKDIDGIMPILDKKCSQRIPKRKDESWYLMPKALPYRVNTYRKIVDKLDAMLRLAHIIETMHQKKCAHRDIKPENILILNDKLMLSDYGLVWEENETRISRKHDKIGPYKILPPELEQVIIETTIDFRPADVYLFAKVLWMTIKEDNTGFRGQYNRGDSQIYLKREKYSVSTFEPLHKLIEEATCATPNRRIPIEKCIEYLEYQKKIILDEHLNENMIKQYQYGERTREVIAKYSPNEVVYDNKSIIFEMLEKIVPIADVYIKSKTDEKDKKIVVSDFDVISNVVCRLSYYYAGKRIKEYQLNIKKMTYSKQTEDIILELDSLAIIDQRFVPFNEGIGNIGNTFPKIYLTPSEKVILKRIKL